MKPLVVIPARGGSKGVPGKNIKLLGDEPLLNYTLKSAREIFPDDIICVSTDDPKIKKVAESEGLFVPFLRPESLATDTSGSYEVLVHAINFYRIKGYNADTLILLQPTSPFRSATHISEAMQLFKPPVEMVVSVKETKANPYYLLYEEDATGILVKSKNSNFVSRQTCPPVYELNGAIYIIDVEILLKTEISQILHIKKYVMDELSSHDIDSVLDWLVAEAILVLKDRNRK